MTQEQKAKAYDEALKRAEAAIDIAADKDLVKGVAITIFPELKESEESEDERIRKAILSFIKQSAGTQELTTKEYSKWIEYLEKQKENPKSADSIPSDCTSDAKCENEHNEEGDFVFELRQIISSHRYSDIYGEYINDEEGMASEILELCKCELEKQQEQKPAEWSEEDELTIADLINYFEGDTLKCSTEEMVQRIKSLRHQPKQEWSKEDIKIMETICKEGDLKPSEKRWLKSLRPQSHWKPSEEQMQALSETIAFAPDTFKPKCTLVTLQDDLKKLME